MAQMSSAELENFQDLSDRYQAELPGPLVSEKLPIGDLVREYSQADPTFIVKTTGLAATHSEYRAIKGDGQCGWRATVFGYFELLLASASSDVVQQERIRIESFKDTILMVGLDWDILQDMFDPTWELFDAIQHAVRNGMSDRNVILAYMNDQNKSDFIVYHFKTMTSAYMRLRPDDYSPFLEMTIDEYCVMRIEPAQQEIDQIGLQVLTDAVIAAAGFGLEVLYLDRSMGDEVTPHSFTQTVHGLPMIRLLYRPGHYDIIYKNMEPLRVHLQHQQFIPQQVEDYAYDSLQDPMAYLFPPAVRQTSDFETGQADPSAFYPQTHYVHNHHFQPQMYVPQYHQPPPPPPRGPSAQNSSNRNSVSPRSMTISPSPSSSNIPVTAEPQIRFHSSMYKMGKYSGVSLAAATASSTANNPSHFTSPAFQPHQYNPEDDYAQKG